MKKKICKLFCTVLSLLLVFGITGCGNKGEEPVQPVTELSEEAIEELHGSLKTTEGSYGFYYDEPLDIETIPAEALLPYVMAEFAQEKGIVLEVASLYTYSDYESFKEKKEDLIAIPKKDIDDYIKSLFGTSRTFTPDVEHKWNRSNSSHCYVYEVHKGAYFLYDVDAEMYYYVSLARAYASVTVHQKLINTEQKGDEIYLYDKAFIDMRHTSGQALKAFAMSNDTAKYHEENDLVNYPLRGQDLPEYVTLGAIEPDAAFELFDTELHTYKHTFKKGKDGNYYWYASEIAERGAVSTEEDEEESDESTAEDPQEEVSKDPIEQLHSSLKTSGSNYGFYFPEDVNIDTISAEQIMPYVMLKYAEENNIDITEIKFDLQFLMGTEIPEDYDMSKDDVISVSKEEIDNFAKTLFNTQREFTLTGSHGDNKQYFLRKLGLGGTCSSFLYDTEKEIYYYGYISSGGSDKKVYQEFIKADQEDDTVFIYDKAFILSRYNGILLDKAFYGERDENTFWYYAFGEGESDSDEEYSKYVNSDGYAVSDAVFEDFDSEINTYKHTFKKGEDGNYYWYASEIVDAI